MSTSTRKAHWEHIYETRSPDEVSWFQPTPQHSLDIIQPLDLPPEAPIIDIGGGDSRLVDHLLELGYQNLTVLDISEAAIQKAQQRLGEKAKQVEWIVEDITVFQPTKQYTLWHDRATFHFLREQSEIERYVSTAAQAIQPGGYLLLGTFSTHGPDRCSGLDVTQYSADSLTDLFREHFEQLDCHTTDHETPSGSAQQFLFCLFMRR